MILSPALHWATNDWRRNAAVLDEEGSETEDDKDDVSNEPICP